MLRTKNSTQQHNLHVYYVFVGIKWNRKKKRSRRPNHPFSCRSNGVAATSVFDYHHGPLKAAAKDICLGEWGQKLSEEEEEKNG